MIPIMKRSEITLIPSGNPFIPLITSNRPSDSLKHTISSHRLIATSAREDARFWRMFGTPLHG